MTYANLVTPGGDRVAARRRQRRPGLHQRGRSHHHSGHRRHSGVAGTGGTGWGNTGVGIILGPGQFNFDTTHAKATRVGGIHENAVLQFRAEFFNLFNHPQFNIPAGLNAGSAGNFGQITSTVGESPPDAVGLEVRVLGFRPHAQQQGGLS